MRKPLIIVGDQDAPGCEDGVCEAPAEEAEPATES